jgi:DNA polymerase III psi subunit
MQLSALQTQVLKEIGITEWVMREQPDVQNLDNSLATLPTAENIDVGTFAVVLPQTELPLAEQQLLKQILFCLQLEDAPVLLTVDQYKTQQFSESTVLFVFDSSLSKEQGSVSNGQMIFNPSLSELLTRPHLKAGVWQCLKHFKTV